MSQTNTSRADITVVVDDVGRMMGTLGCGRREGRASNQRYRVTSSRRVGTVWSATSLESLQYCSELS
jgi:hypothetical protein